jgi:radical SAM superfamily enzyme YgiQ (UPF0313 family)
MRVLLISTYELGHQPLHLAAPAADLMAAGHEVTTRDLAVESWSPEVLEDVQVVAISVPMHTALRLALEVARRIRRAAPSLPIAFYGLYAGVGRGAISGLADRLICGEYEDALVEWVARLAGGGAVAHGTTVSIGRRRFLTPERGGLPPLHRYAHLATPAGHELVGYVEASHGCRHRCAHCPIPAVYDGRYRITGEGTVLSDISRLVEAGAGHVTFGDPDFLNAPVYSLKVLEEAHRRFPHLTYDVTVKVEHIIEHRHLLGRMAEAGVLFLVSAMETLDDDILARLDKGHSAVDAARGVDLVRRAGIDIHPTWLPFTPWTTAASVADIARFVWSHDLAPVTDPVQLSIRLLIPDGSLLLDVPDLAPHLLGYDENALGYRWRSADPAMDELQARLATMADDGATTGEDSLTTLSAMARVIGETAGSEIGVGLVGAEARPRLTEPWFC